MEKNFYIDLQIYSDHKKMSLRGIMKGSKENRKEKKIKKVMHEFKEGELHSGSKKGPVVKDKAQALAIIFSEARKKKK